MAQDMLAKVRALLDTADSYAETGQLEAEASYRAKAEQLMKSYRIQEEDLIAKDPASLVPVMIPVVLLNGTGNPFLGDYINLYNVIARHAGVRIHPEWVRGTDGTYQVMAKTVGYESDIRYAEMLYTAARLVFSERLQPKVDPAKSDQVNAYRLRSAGMERIRVAEALWGNTDKIFLARVGRLYKAECKARNEVPALDGRGITGKAFREQYASEFVWSFAYRLRQAGDAAGSYGGALTLHGRQERVDEAFYEQFPNYRPLPATQEEPKECEKCATTKHASGQCRDHRPRDTSRADAAATARYYSPAAVRGRQAGAAAAREVSLQRGYREGLEQ